MAEIKPFRTTPKKPSSGGLMRAEVEADRQRAAAGIGAPEPFVTDQNRKPVRYTVAPMYDPDADFAKIRRERDLRENLRRQRAAERGEKFKFKTELGDSPDRIGARTNLLEKARIEALTQQRNKEKKAKAGGRAENILTSRTDEPKSLLRGL